MDRDPRGVVPRRRSSAGMGVEWLGAHDASMMTPRRMDAGYRSAATGAPLSSSVSASDDITSENIG
jgi:hypothetical protein